MSSRQSKLVLWGSAATLAVVLAFSIAVLIVIETQWFKNQVRARIGSTVEKATGGRLEIDRFDYNWKTLTAVVSGIKLHGTEPEDCPPLFEARRVEIGLKIVSFFRRDIDIQNLLVDNPAVYVLIRPDGSTNIPSPRVSPETKIQWPDLLVKLAVGHFELRQGSVEIDHRKSAIDARGDRLTADVLYEPAAAGYRGHIAMQRFVLNSKHWLPAVSTVAADFQFERDRLNVPSFGITLPRSRLSGAAELTTFSNPTVRTHLKAQIDLAEAGNLLKFRPIEHGNLDVEGDGLYSNGSYSFSGALDGRGIRYRAARFDVRDARVRSGVVINSEGLSLPRLSASAFGATAEGEVRLSASQEFRFKGRLRGLNVREAGPFFNRAIAWNGFAAGPLEMSGRFENGHPQGFLVKSALAVAPGVEGIPVSGDVRLEYAQHGNSLKIDDAHLILPNSTVNAAGKLAESLTLSIESTNLADVEPVVALFAPDGKAMALPAVLDSGRAAFHGTVAELLHNPQISGHASAERIIYQGRLIEKADADVNIDQHKIALSNATASGPGVSVNGIAEIGLANWRWQPEQPLSARFNATSDDLALLAKQLRLDRRLPLRGRAEFSGTFSGTYENLQGAGRLRGRGLDAQGQLIDAISADLRFAGDRAYVERGMLRAADASARFSADYQRSALDWLHGRLKARFDTRGFQLDHLLLAQAFLPGVNANVEMHFDGAAQISGSRMTVEAVDGSAQFKAIAVRGIHYGQLSIRANTQQRVTAAQFSGNLRDSHLSGGIKIALSGDYDAQGDAHLSAIHLSTIKELVPGLKDMFLPVDGLVEGSGTFTGPLARPSAIAGIAKLNNLQLAPELDEPSAAGKIDSITLRNAAPIEVAYKDRTIVVTPFEMTAKDTNVSASGRFALDSNSPLDFRVNGDVNLQLLRLFDASWTSNGTSRLNATATGSLSNPNVNGTLEIRDGSFYLADFTNGIDHANGTVRFDRNRATIQKLSAQSGGGTLSLTGFVGFGSGTPLVYHLEAAAQGVRVRYNGVSSTFDADLKYTGTTQSSLLAGDITVTKAAFTPNTDVGSLFAATAAPVVVARAQNERLRRIRLEINILSSSTLQLTASLSQDVQADIDLRLRGTPDRPVLLGRFSLNEGQIQFFGNKYTINRGEVNFYNPLKIEPVLDLDLETQARGITVTINITGTIDKLNVNYRSDPPLQPREIIALLATGRTPDQVSASPGGQTLSQNGVLAAPNTILGSAMSPASNRLQRFFGVTHLKIDPMLQGIENVPQARLTLEQQISRQITVTYVTNLSRTAEQIFRFEWALNREYSLVAIRDENGLFGVDVQYKRRFK